LGGKLLYAGELVAQGRALVVAANIAGAASLAASADAEACKQAIREGVADFLVTSLDEALRILKNEIRKRETVAVCVGLAAAKIEIEIEQRGVLPDLLAPGAAIAQFNARRIKPVAVQAADALHGQALLAWSVPSAPALWMPRIDALAADCLRPEEAAARRWLRLSPRYLGRLAQGVRLLRCSEASATRFLDETRSQVERGEIGVPVEVRLSCRNESKVHRFSPPVH
jgi:hypothetical protein